VPLATTEDVHGILDIFAKTAQKIVVEHCIGMERNRSKKGVFVESRLEKKIEQTPSQLLFDARWAIGWV